MKQFIRKITMIFSFQKVNPYLIRSHVLTAHFSSTEVMSAFVNLLFISVMAIREGTSFRASAFTLFYVSFRIGVTPSIIHKASSGVAPG